MLVAPAQTPNWPSIGALCQQALAKLCLKPPSKQLGSRCSMLQAIHRRQPGASLTPVGVQLRGQLSSSSHLVLQRDFVKDRPGVGWRVCDGIGRPRDTDTDLHVFCLCMNRMRSSASRGSNRLMGKMEAISHRAWGMVKAGAPLLGVVGHGPGNDGRGYTRSCGDASQAKCAPYTYRAVSV